MKKLLTFLLLIIVVNSYSQTTFYIDASAVWKPMMQAGGGLDVGVNIGNISIEANSMALNYSRIGGSVGWQLGERGGEWLGMRPYAGLMYGEYSLTKEDGAPTANQWHATAGFKLMMGAWQSNFQYINAKQPEVFLTIGVQVVEIIKYIKRN